MSNLTFEEVRNTLVKLDDKVVGEIRQVPFKNNNPFVKHGYQYFPKGSKTGGEIFENKTKCINSLREE